MDLIYGISQNIAAFIIVVAVLVFIHEFGHYYVAVRNRVKVETFAIGFGPELFGWNDRKGTRWKVCLLPLGGYVKMFGDVDPASVKQDADKVAAMSPQEREGAFFAKPVGVRAAIVAAGPGINFLFCIVALFLLYLTIGQSYLPPQVGKLIEGKPAAAAGIQVGDVIKAIDDTKIEDFSDIRQMMSLGLDRPIVVTVERNGETLSIPVTPEVEEITNNFGAIHRTGRLGIGSADVPEYRRLGPLEAVEASLKDTWKLIKGTFVGVYQIIAGERSSRELGGVITIAKMSGDMSHSIASFVWFMAMLSANLGLINLFPIPVLDGGHLVFYAFEAVRGKPLSELAQEYSLRFGLALVLTLTMFALWNDLNTFGVVQFFAKLI